MTLKLRLANVESLADGGPVRFSVEGRGFEFGRDPAMDWTLPDPQRFVSSCHGEVRFENGGYWLYDRSMNGTFVNGSAMRVKSPYALQKEDRIQVGGYILLVEELIGPAAAPEMAQPASPIGSPATPPPAAADIWSLGDAAGAPVPNFDPTPPPPRRGDFGDQHIAIPGFAPGPEAAPVAPSPAPSAPAAPAAGADASPFGPAPTPPAAPAPKEEPPVDFGLTKGTEANPVSEATPAPAAREIAPAPLPEPSMRPMPGAAAPIPQSPAPAPIPQAAPSVPQAAAPPQATAMPSAPPMPQPAPPVASMEPAAAAFGAPPPQSKSVAPPPMETPAAEPVPAPPPPPAAGMGGDAAALLRTVAEGAGLSPDAFAGADPHASAHEIGRALRIMTAELTALLRVRTTVKTSFRSGDRTQLGRDANNPLKFIPSSEEALEAMFGKPRPGYQRGAEAVQASFTDIQRHQSAVFAAIQPALAEIVGDMAPESIESKVDAGAFSSKSARAWELYVERWDAKTAPHENGMLDVFNLYFAKNYDAQVKGSKK